MSQLEALCPQHHHHCQASPTPRRSGQRKDSSNTQPSPGFLGLFHRVPLAVLREMKKTPLVKMNGLGSMSLKWAPDDSRK